jgi:hypothetical protein
MEPLEAADLSHCNLCLLQTVTIQDLESNSELQARKHKLFHEACHHCDDLKSSTFAKVCNRSRNPRIQHLLVCCPDMDHEFHVGHLGRFETL